MQPLPVKGLGSQPVSGHTPASGATAFTAQMAPAPLHGLHRPPSSQSPWRWSVSRYAQASYFQRFRHRTCVLRCFLSVGGSQGWKEEGKAIGSYCCISFWCKIPRMLKILNRNLPSGHYEGTCIQRGREAYFIEQIASVSYDSLIFRRMVCGLHLGSCLGPTKVLARPVA